MSRYTILRPDQVGIDGIFKTVDLSDLDPSVESVQFDTVQKEGIVHYVETSTTAANVRDLEAEHAAYEKALKTGGNLNKLEPIFKAVKVRKPPMRLTSFESFQHYLIRWSSL